MSPNETRVGDPHAQPGQVLHQHEAGAAGGLQRQAGRSRRGMAGRERGVQADAGVGHAETGRPDHPHAVAAADAQQLRAGRAAEPGRDHHQRPDAPPPAVLGDPEHRPRRDGDDRQVDLLGQRGRRRQAADAVQLSRARVDRVDRAREAAVDEVLQDRPPDRSGAPARADDRDRGRHQHGPHARHVRGPLPHGDRIAVGAQGGIGLVGGQRERQVIHAVHQGALRLQPGVGEYPQHGRVLAQRLRGKGAEPPAAGQRDQVLQQQHADAAVMQVIGDRERDLRRPGPSAGLLVGAAADHLPVQHGQQRRVVRPGLAAYPARLPLGRERAHAEKTQVQVVRGHLGVHVPHRVEVIGPRRPDLDRGAVDQQSVSTVLRMYAHATLPVLPPARHAATQSALSVTAAPRAGAPATE